MPSDLGAIWVRSGVRDLECVQPGLRAFLSCLLVVIVMIRSQRL
jgi:hypothetical protein